MHAVCGYLRAAIPTACDKQITPWLLKQGWFFEKMFISQKKLVLSKVKTEAVFQVVDINKYPTLSCI